MRAQLDSHDTFPLAKASRLGSLTDSWSELYTQLQPAFQDIFPIVTLEIANIWNDCEIMTGLPATAILPLRTETISSKLHCFLPRTVLRRFLDVVIENLRTCAFVGWTASQRLEAKVEFSVFVETVEAGQPRVCLQLTDNGPLYRTCEVPSHSGTGLQGLSEMIKPFGGDLRRPTQIFGHTTVRLYVMSRGTLE